MQEFATGVTALRGYLSWKATEHKRDQCRLGAKLVESYMAKHWQFETIARTAAGAAKDVVGKRHKVSPRLLLLLDFNVPPTRGLTRLQKLAGQVAGVLQSTPDAGLGSTPPTLPGRNPASPATKKA